MGDDMNDSETPPWTLEKVRRALDNYAELYELSQGGFVESNWLRKVRSMNSVRSYPARFNLLTSKWDIERAVSQLTERYQALFYLRYWAHYTQGEIGRVLGCSRQTVAAALKKLPELILSILVSDGGQSVSQRGEVRWGGKIPRRRPREVFVWRAD